MRRGTCGATPLSPLVRFCSNVNRNAARRNAYKELTSKSEPILRNLSDQDLGHYFDRVKLYGDAAAERWVINKGP